MNPEDWYVAPSTTDGQYQWTNLKSGIKLSLLEAIQVYVTTILRLISIH